jgi:hypothetical protein
MNRPTRGAGPLLLLLACLAPACGGQDETRPPKWSYISTAIIQPNCATANCHSSLSQRSGVVLNGIRVGYQQLIGRSFVLPGKPDDSAVMALMNGEGSRRMPPDIALAKVDIDLIGAWIAGGAVYDGPGTTPVLTAAGTGN